MEKIYNSQLTQSLEDLFDNVPPAQLRKSMHEIFSSYLQSIDEITDLDHFKILAEDFYFLYRFLEEIEENGLKKNG